MGIKNAFYKAMGSAQPDFGGIKKMFGIIYGRPWKNHHRKFFLELSDQLFGVEGRHCLWRNEQDPSRQWWGFSSCKGWYMNKKKKKKVCAYQEIARIDSSIPLMQVDKITFYFVKCFLWVNPIFFMRLFFYEYYM